MKYRFVREINFPSSLGCKKSNFDVRERKKRNVLKSVRFKAMEWYKYQNMIVYFEVTFFFSFWHTASKIFQQQMLFVVALSRSNFHSSWGSSKGQKKKKKKTNKKNKTVQTACCYYQLTAILPGIPLGFTLWLPSLPLSRTIHEWKCVLFQWVFNGHFISYSILSLCLRQSLESMDMCQRSLKLTLNLLTSHEQFIMKMIYVLRYAGQAHIGCMYHLLTWSSLFLFTDTRPSSWAYTHESNTHTKCTAVWPATDNFPLPSWLEGDRSFFFFFFNFVCQ